MRLVETDFLATGNHFIYFLDIPLSFSRLVETHFLNEFFIVASRNGFSD